MPAETISAMDGAGPSCYHQNPGTILVQQPGTAGRGRSPTGSGVKPAADGLFILQREHLPQQRVARISWPHAGDVAARGKHGKIASRQLCARDVLRRQIDQPAQLGRVADGVFQGLLPGAVARHGNGRRSSGSRDRN